MQSGTTLNAVQKSAPLTCFVFIDQTALELKVNVRAPGVCYLEGGSLQAAGRKVQVAFGGRRATEQEGSLKTGKGERERRRLCLKHQAQLPGGSEPSRWYTPSPAGLQSHFPPFGPGKGLAGLSNVPLLALGRSRQGQGCSLLSLPNHSAQRLQGQTQPAAEPRLWRERKGRR